MDNRKRITYIFVRGIAILSCSYGLYKGFFITFKSYKMLYYTNISNITCLLYYIAFFSVSIVDKLKKTCLKEHLIKVQHFVAVSIAVTCIIYTSSLIIGYNSISKVNLVNLCLHFITPVLFCVDQLVLSERIVISYGMDHLIYTAIPIGYYTLVMVIAELGITTICPRTGTRYIYPGIDPHGSFIDILIRIAGSIILFNILGYLFTRNSKKFKK